MAKKIYVLILCFIKFKRIKSNFFEIFQILLNFIKQSHVVSILKFPIYFFHTRTYIYFSMNFDCEIKLNKKEFEKFGKIRLKNTKKMSIRNSNISHFPK